MAACEKALFRWGEMAVSEIVMSRAAAAASVVPFTQPAESVSGADWVWWWVDSTSAYGMLVQAKRLTVHQDRWRFDFGYRGRACRQRVNLRSTAASLGLVPVYALYLGTADYRNWQMCSDDHRVGRCLSCVKRSVSLMPALLADPAVVNDYEETYKRSFALEEAWKPSSMPTQVIPALLEQMDPELINFLLTPQAGVRAVAQSMIDGILRVRSGQLDAVSRSDPSVLRGSNHDQLGPVFPDLPLDTGHWGFPYFEHVLDPLQHVPPDYVLEVESQEFDADELASTMPSQVAGVVVVRLSQNG